MKSPKQKIVRKKQKIAKSDRKNPSNILKNPTPHTVVPQEELLLHTRNRNALKLSARS